MIPEIAYEILLEYKNLDLVSVDEGIFSISEIGELRGHEVTYRLKGLNLTLKTDVNELLQSTAHSYVRAQTRL